MSADSDKIISRTGAALDADPASITNAIAAMIASFDGGGTLLICGNGGSAADADHIAGEMLKGFCLPRALNGDQRAAFADDADSQYMAETLQNGLPTIAFTAQGAAASAIANDLGEDLIFAQQLWAYGKPGDVLLAITTSGNSRNVCLAAKAAQAKGITVIGLTGETGGALLPLTDICIRVPSQDVATIQERHLPIYHHFCTEIEAYFFGG